MRGWMRTRTGIERCRQRIVSPFAYVPACEAHGAAQTTWPLDLVRLSVGCMDGYEARDARLRHLWADKELALLKRNGNAFGRQAARNNWCSPPPRKLGSRAGCDKRSSMVSRRSLWFTVAALYGPGESWYTLCDPDT